MPSWRKEKEHPRIRGRQSYLLLVQRRMVKLSAYMAAELAHLATIGGANANRM